MFEPLQKIFKLISLNRWSTSTVPQSTNPTARTATTWPPTGTSSTTRCRSATPRPPPPGRPTTTSSPPAPSPQRTSRTPPTWACCRRHRSRTFPIRGTATLRRRSMVLIWYSESSSLVAGVTASQVEGYLKMRSDFSVGETLSQQLRSLGLCK